jgi:vancomycin resistance protein YoaR
MPIKRFLGLGVLLLPLLLLIGGLSFWLGGETQPKRPLILVWDNQSWELTPETIVNESLFQGKIATMAAEIYFPAKPPEFQYIEQENKLLIENGESGQELDKQTLLALIKNRLASGRQEPINLPIKEIPAISEREIKDYVAELAGLINQEPQDALFRFESGKAIAFRPSKNGLALNQEQTVQLIKQGEKAIILPTQPLEPKIKMGDTNRFGIKQKIGAGQSAFRGSIPNRIHNIQLAANRFSGILIPPGEEFSFNQKLGEISLETGFKQAYIIKGQRTILGDGGGVCQVSTTLFRAALTAGLPILERHSHAYRVAYYEQDSPVGFDATVFAPTVDFKLKNDTPAYLLIQAEFNPQNQTLTFEIFGTDDGRKVLISNGRIWNKAPPPPPLYQDDPTLPSGTTKQIDWAAWGAKAAFDWKVTRNGEVLQDRTFFSAYQPWQAIYLRGTKQ